VYTNSFVTSLNGRSINSTDVIEVTRSDLSFTPGEKSGITVTGSEARNISVSMIETRGKIDTERSVSCTV
jgi:hypothetical protein